MVTTLRPHPAGTPASPRHRCIGSQGRRYRCAARFPRPPFNPYVRLSGSKLSARTGSPMMSLVTFLKAALRSRTVGFPESGSDLGSARHLSENRPAHACGGLSADPHTPLAPVVCPSPRQRDQDSAQVMVDGRRVVHRPGGFPAGLDVRRPGRPPEGRLDRVVPAMSSRVPGSLATQCPGPLCPPGVLPGCYPRSERPHGSPGRALPLRHRSYGPMRQTKTLRPPRIPPCARGLCRLLSAPAGRWPFPTLSLRPLRRCSDPYPATLLGCTCPFLHREHRSHPTGNGFDAQIYPHTATSVGSRLSRLQSFDHLRAPTLARPPGCSDRGAVGATHSTPGRRAFHTTQNPAGHPHRAVASLHVRHGQLTWLDSHQLGRSLVGCSFPHTASR
jgi:hypothetical protein